MAELYILLSLLILWLVSPIALTIYCMSLRHKITVLKQELADVSACQLQTATVTSEDIVAQERASDDAIVQEVASGEVDTQASPSVVQGSFAQNADTQTENNVSPVPKRAVPTYDDFPLDGLRDAPVENTTQPLRAPAYASRFEPTTVARTAPRQTTQKTVPPVQKRKDWSFSSQNYIQLIMFIGVAFILTAGLIFATTSWNAMDSLAKVLVIFAVSALFFTASFVAHSLLDLSITDIVFYELGCLFIPVAVLCGAYFTCFGAWFNLEEQFYWVQFVIIALYCASTMLGYRIFQKKWFHTCAIVTQFLGIFVFAKALNCSFYASALFVCLYGMYLSGKAWRNTEKTAQSLLFHVCLYSAVSLFADCLSLPTLYHEALLLAIAVIQFVLYRYLQHKTTFPIVTYTTTLLNCALFAIVTIGAHDAGENILALCACLLLLGALCYHYMETASIDNTASEKTHAFCSHTWYQRVCVGVIGLSSLACVQLVSDCMPKEATTYLWLVASVLYLVAGWLVFKHFHTRMVHGYTYVFYACFALCNILCMDHAFKHPSLALSLWCTFAYLYCTKKAPFVEVAMILFGQMALPVTLNLFLKDYHQMFPFALALAGLCAIVFSQTRWICQKRIAKYSGYATFFFGAAPVLGEMCFAWHPEVHQLLFAGVLFALATTVAQLVPNNKLLNCIQITTFPLLFSAFALLTEETHELFVLALILFALSVGYILYLYCCRVPLFQYANKRITEIQYTFASAVLCIYHFGQFYIFQSESMQTPLMQLLLPFYENRFCLAYLGIALCCFYDCKKHGATFDKIAIGFGIACLYGAWSNQALVPIHAAWEMLYYTLGLVFIVIFLEQQKTIYTHYKIGAYLLYAAAILGQAGNCLDNERLTDVLILGTWMFLTFLFALYRKRIGYFVLSLTTSIVLWLYVTRQFWMQFSWWVYLLVVGCACIAIAVHKELRDKNTAHETKNVFQTWTR